MKAAKLSYLILGMGLLLLTLSPVIGASLSAKLSELYGLHQTNKITATFQNEARQQGRGAISLEDMRQLAQYGLWGYDLAYALETSASAAYQNKQSPVHVLGVNDRYRQFHQIKLLAGSFLTAAQENQQVAVIDEELALTLFQNCNVVGLNLELYGRTFKIVGVAGQDPSLVGTLTERETGTVYLPVKKLLELEESAGITSLEIETKDAGTTGYNTAVMKTALLSIGQDPAGFRLIDYTLEHRLLAQKNRLRDFLVGAGAIIILLVLLKRIIREVYHFLRMRLEEKYLREVIKADFTRLLLSLAKVLALVTLMFVIWNLIRFPLYIAPENIPNELIDLSFWADLWKETMQAGIQSTAYPALPGEDQLRLLHLIQNWNIALSLFLGLPLFSLGLYQATTLGEEPVKVAGFCLAVMVGALLTGSTLLAATKMPLAIGTRGVFLLFTAVYLTIISFAGRSKAHGQFAFTKHQ